jgi:ferrous iron transport protein A
VNGESVAAPRNGRQEEEVAMTLNDLTVGGRARIRDVTGDDALALRLMEMGLTEDEPIEFLGTAPLGDPLEFSVRGYRISLRQSEAARVLVEPLPDVG